MNKKNRKKNAKKWTWRRGKSNTYEIVLFVMWKRSALFFFLYFNQCWRSFGLRSGLSVISVRSGPVFWSTVTEDRKISVRSGRPWPKTEKFRSGQNFFNDPSIKTAKIIWIMVYIIYYDIKKWTFFEKCWEKNRNLKKFLDRSTEYRNFSVRSGRPWPKTEKFRLTANTESVQL